MDRRDVFLLAGLLCIVGGIAFQFGPAWAGIVCGVFLLFFGFFGGDK